jgi:hypothetical protein
MKRLALALVIVAALAAWRLRHEADFWRHIDADEANRHSREHLHLYRVEGLL